MTQYQELTPEELKWLKGLQRQLDKCPSDRLGFYTIGDDRIGIYNLEFSDQISNIKDDLVRTLSRNGWGFDEAIYFPAQVESVCG